MVKLAYFVVWHKRRLMDTGSRVLFVFNKTAVRNVSCSVVLEVSTQPVWTCSILVSELLAFCLVFQT